MAKKKHTYRIIINKENAKKNTYSYKYGNTKNIQLSIGLQSICIELDMGPLYEFEKIIFESNDIFSDAIKKAMLVHLIYYSKNLEIKKIIVYIDEESKEFDYSQAPFIFTMLKDLDKGAIPDSWKEDDFINKVLNNSSHGKNEKLSAFYALLYAKCQTYRMERFIHLWVAYNGFYNSLYMLDHGGSLTRVDHKGKTVRSSESARIKNVLIHYGYGNKTLSEKERNAVIYKIFGCLKSWDENPVTKESLENGIHQELAKSIESHLVDANNQPIVQSVYGYLVSDFGYYFRCHYIHGNVPLKIFSFATESELKYLKLINGVLENFLDEHMIEIL